jgi:cell division septum initiation protein DivIVA
MRVAAFVEREKKLQRQIDRLERRLTAQKNINSVHESIIRSLKEQLERADKAYLDIITRAKVLPEHAAVINHFQDYCYRLEFTIDEYREYLAKHPPTYTML